KGFGIKLAQENVGRCMSRDPQLFKYLREAISDAAFVLDIKQTFRSDCSADTVIEAMGKNIRHLHISDANADNDCLPIGEGDFDFCALFAKLQRFGYSGDAVLELYSHSYTHEEQLWSSLAQLREMTETVKISL
ncbi:MAG: sugar phosphate isomerase/epimerase, partial [Angelakisella sp.]